MWQVASVVFMLVIGTAMFRQAYEEESQGRGRTETFDRAVVTLIVIGVFLYVMFGF